MWIIVRFHKEINFPESFGKPAVRCGGGWWDANNGVLKLYDDSVDFGKYDLETAKEAFEKHNVYYDNKNVFDKDYSIFKEHFVSKKETSIEGKNTPFTCFLNNN